MATWSADELDKIGRADELQIAPARRDGTLRRPTTIWVVRHGNDLYVRSYHGRDGGWFRHALQSHQGQIRADGIERDVVFEEPDDSVRGAIDQAYRMKYARNGSTYVIPMVSPDAAVATLKLIPR